MSTMFNKQGIKVIAFFIVQVFLLSGISQAADAAVIDMNCLAPVLEIESAQLRTFFLKDSIKRRVQEKDSNTENIGSQFKPVDISLQDWFINGHLGTLYHKLKHSKDVSEFADMLGQRIGLSRDYIELLRYAGLFHDFDPHRPFNTPARVQETLQLLADDFFEKSSLEGISGESLLKKRLNWTEREYYIVKALILRTEFPFSDSHPKYVSSSPVEEYRKILTFMRENEAFTEKDILFVLTFGAYLSEYADKTSVYAFMSSVDDALNVQLEVVKNYVTELNIREGKPVFTIETFNNYQNFLAKIGSEEVFEFDYQLAEEFGIENFYLLRLNEFFKIMPKDYEQKIRTVQCVGKAFEEQIIRNPSNYEEAVRVAEEQAKQFLKTYKSRQMLMSPKTIKHTTISLTNRKNIWLSLQAEQAI